MLLKGRGFFIGEVDSEITVDGSLDNQRSDTNTPFGPMQTQLDNSGSLVIQVKRNNENEEFKITLNHKVIMPSLYDFAKAETNRTI